MCCHVPLSGNNLNEHIHRYSVGLVMYYTASPIEIPVEWGNFFPIKCLYSVYIVVVLFL